MGLGKTLMTISLIVSDFDNPDINTVDVKTASIAKSGSDIIDLVDENSNDDDDDDDNDDDDNDNNDDDDDNEDFILEKKRKLKAKNKSVKVFKSQNNNPNTSFISNSSHVPSFFTKRIQNKKTYGTLIVTPMSLMGQWIDEIKNKTAANSVSSYMYYGNNTNIDISSVDIVVTSYGTLVSEAKSFLKAMSGLSTEEKQDIANLDDMDSSASALRKGLLAVKWVLLLLLILLLSVFTITITIIFRNVSFWMKVTQSRTLLQRLPKLVQHYCQRDVGCFREPLFKIVWMICILLYVI